ncbi:MAG: LemA family protein [Clostridia bacterium]|jgi:LemA protein|nr:LemA family protein [Clostridia bacterium]
MEIFVGILILIIILVIFLYNNLIRLRSIVNNAFSSTDVILKRRYDLIPNLVETVKGYMDHEESVLIKVTELRTQALENGVSIDKKIKIDKDISSDMNKIFALSEGYPELKSSENFLKLQTAIIDTEDEVAAARRTFNAAATEYNINIKVFPSNIFATLMGFNEISLFETKDTENVNIKLR